MILALLCRFKYDIIFIKNNIFLELKYDEYYYTIEVVDRTTQLQVG